jgi:predicted SAM-dependent methyltransferase
MSGAMSAASATTYVQIDGGAAAGGPVAHRCSAGFVRVDGRPQALAAAGGKLPFADGSLAGIYLSHVIEHLDLAEGARLFQECRRVLARGGRLRVVTEDLGRVLEQFGSPEAWVAGGWFENGYDWGQIRCDMLNRAFREGGRRWLYDSNEIARVAAIMGLHAAQRCRAGESGDPRLVGLETAGDTDLIVELIKPVRVENGARPLVSVLVPLYRPTYLTQTVASVLDQTYDNFELILCDDGEPGVAAPILQSFTAHPRFDRIRYFANPRRMGDAANYLACFARARGAYVKYLNDDDLLAPRCLEVMAACLHAYPDVTLVTSHRRIIDHLGNPQPDVKYSERPVGRSSLVSGRSAIAEMLRTQLNFIGEPSTVMFRRLDVESMAPSFWSLGGINFVGNGDVTMWLNLLGQGDAIYLTESLSSFRRHPTQTSHDPQVIRLAQIAWHRAARGAEGLGLYDSQQAGGWLEALPLPEPPWWPASLRAGIDRAVHSLRSDPREQALTEVRRALAQAEAMGDAAAVDVELGVLLAELRFAAGDLRGALNAAIALTRSAPHHQPAYLLIASLLLAAGDAHSARNVFKETQAIYPLIRNRSGVAQTPDGSYFLHPEACFVLAADLPDLTLELKLHGRTGAGFRNLPLRFSVSVDGTVVQRRQLTADGEALAITLALPRRPAPTVITVDWRGQPDRHLPGQVAPLSVQIMGLELSLAAPPAGQGVATAEPAR